MASSIPEDIYQPDIDPKSEKRVLILTGDQTEDLEFFYPYYRFIEAGHSVDVATPDGGKVKGKHGLTLKETMRIADADALDYDLLYIPGGAAPEKLRQDEEVLALTRQFVEYGKPVSSICHGPQILAAANVITGHRISAWPEVEKEVEAAGAIFVNDSPVIDDQFITARWPADLPNFMSRTVEILENYKSGNLEQN